MLLFCPVCPPLNLFISPQLHYMEKTRISFKSQFKYPFPSVNHSQPPPNLPPSSGSSFHSYPVRKQCCTTQAHQRLRQRQPDLRPICDSHSTHTQHLPMSSTTLGTKDSKEQTPQPCLHANFKAKQGKQTLIRSSQKVSTYFQTLSSIK